MIEDKGEITDQTLTYTEAAEGYYLDVKLSAKRLRLDLTDIESGIIYEKQFDNTTQINGLDIIEIYHTFTQEPENNDELKQKKKTEVSIDKKEVTKIATNNKIGDRVLKKNGSYEVLKGGKINFCISLTYPNSKKIFSEKINFQLKQKKKMDMEDKFDLKLRNIEEKLQIKHKEEIKELKQQIKYLKAKIQQNLNISVYAAEDSSFHYKFSLLKKNEILYIGQDANWTQLLMKDVIPFDQQVSFKLKIKKSTNFYIMFGVCDKVNRAKERYSYNSGYCTCYYACNGYVYGPNNTQNTGFRVNEEVVMTVKLSEPKVTWAVDGVLKATSTSDLLKNKNYIFVPYIQMYNNGDCVEWLGLMK